MPLEKWKHLCSLYQSAVYVGVKETEMVRTRAWAQNMKLWVLLKEGPKICASVCCLFSGNALEFWIKAPMFENGGWSRAGH